MPTPPKKKTLYKLTLLNGFGLTPYSPLLHHARIFPSWVEKKINKQNVPRLIRHVFLSNERHIFQNMNQPTLEIMYRDPLILRLRC